MKIKRAVWKRQSKKSEVLYTYLFLLLLYLVKIRAVSTMYQDLLRALRSQRNNYTHLYFQGFIIILGKQRTSW